MRKKCEKPLFWAFLTLTVKFQKKVMNSFRETAFRTNERESLCLQRLRRETKNEQINLTRSVGYESSENIFHSKYFYFQFLGKKKPNMHILLRPTVIE